MATKERRTEMFFTASGREVVGFECEHSPGYWWVPSEGSSMCVGYSLFKSKREGLEKGRATLLSTLADAKKRLAEIEAELASL
jgi:hypothetical protein